MTSRVQQFIFLLFLFFSFSAHANKNISLSPLNDGLLEIRFSKLEDLNKYENAYIVRGRYNTFYATLPDSITSTDVNIEFVSSKNSSVKINGTTLPNFHIFIDSVEVSISRGIVKFDSNISIELENEDGNINHYDLLAKKGVRELDSIVYEFKEKYNIPGVSFAVANLEKSDVVYNSGYGYAIKEDKIPVRTDHLFRLASMSKQHTAIAILKLIEDGKIGIDDYVFGPNGILKDQFDNVPLKAQRITVRHLLEHTSGYNRKPDYMFDGAYRGWSMRRRIQAMLKSRQPNEPGAVFSYYNTGYGILGYIVEAVSGQTFEAYLKQIYASVGIDDIHVGGTQSERRSNEVAYYSQSSSSAEGVDMELRAPAGGLIASTEQLMKLLWVLDGNPLVPDLITCETRDLMFTPSETGKSRYALGWRTNHDYFPYSFYHGGNLSGVATLWVYSHGYAVVFLCNSRSLSRQFDDDLYRMVRNVIELCEFSPNF